MNDTDTPAIPQTRSLARPFFLIRTPDGLESYFRREYVKALFHHKDPLTRFLAPASLNKTRQPPEIVYDYQGLPLDTFRPLDYISEGELKMFREAAEAFYGKARVQVTNVTPFEKDLRRAFRLPDPDKEPDAYWLYGPPNDRRLLVLWGAEIERDSSLPIAAVEGVTEGPNVMDKLAARVLPWEGKQQQAIDLARDRSEALSAHLAQPTYNARHELTAAIVGGKRLTAAELKPAKALKAAQIEAFHTAALAFYQKAFDPATSEFEKELRLSLRLPDPRKYGDRYRIAKTGQIVVLVDGTEHRAATLPATDDPDHDFPPQSAAETTAVEELRKKVRPWYYYAIPAAAGVAMVIGASLFFILSDSKPPELVDIQAVNDPTLITITFNEPIAPDSLLSAEEKAALNTPEDPKVKPKRNFDLRNISGNRISVTPTLNRSNPAQVLLRVEAMNEKDAYKLSITGVADTKGNAVSEQIKEQSISYRDQLSPKLLNASADGTDDKALTLVFDEPLSPDMARNTYNYQIPGFQFIGADMGENPNEVIIRANKIFTSGEQYVIEVRGVGDISMQRNPVPQDKPEVLEFAYIDTIAPRVIDVAASELQVMARVTFNERIDPNTANTAGSFIITDPDGANVVAKSAELMGDGQTVELRVPPLKSGVEYSLRATGVQDLSSLHNKVDPDVAVAFRYSGPTDEEDPYIAAIEAMPDNRTLKLTFNEEVTADSVLYNQNFLLNDPSFVISEIRKVSNNPRSFFVKLNEKLKAGVEYQLTVKKLEDLVGNVSEDVTSRRFMTKDPIFGAPTVLTMMARPLPDGSAIEVTLSDEAADGPARDVTRWRLEGNAVTDVLIAEDSRTLTLKLARPLAKGTHELFARNIALRKDPSRVQGEMSTKVTF